MIVDNGKYYLYRHIRCDKDKPFYVGVGSKEYAKRIDGYDRAFSKSARTKFWKNIAHSTTYDIEILLESDSYEFILQKEIEFIRLYGRRDLGLGTLANLTDGGEGVRGRRYKPSPESIEKMRKKLTGRKLPPEQVENIRRRMKGRISPMRGRRQTDKCREATRNRMRNRKLSDETKMKLSLVKRGKPVTESTYAWRYKRIMQLSKDGVFIKEWNNIRDAAREYKVGVSEISVTCKALRGDYPVGHKSYNRKTCKGYIWKYKEE